MLIYLFSLLISCILFYEAPTSMNKGFMINCLTIVALNIAYFILMRSKNGYSVRKIYVRHSFIFIICFFIVFFQADLDYVLGFIDGSLKLLWIDNSIVCKSMALSTMALSSILLGYSVFRNRETSIKNFSPASYIYSTSNKKEICYAGYGLLVFYLLVVPRSYLYGGYNSGADRGWANVILVLLQALFIAVFALYCYEFRQRSVRKNFFQELKAPIILVLVYIGIVLITGRRTEAVRMALLLLIAYSYAMGRMANNKMILIITISSAVIFSATRVLRSGDTNEFRKSIEIVADASSISPFTQELSSSVNTLHVAVSNFPERYNYTNGLTFFPNFFILVPGLDRFYQSNIRGAGVITNSADLITNIEIGKEAGYGMGSSIVADVYIAFGPIGVVIAFIILGIFIRYLEVGTFAMMKSPYFIVLSLGCCSQFMFACRGTVANLFLSWSYATLIIFFFSKRIKRSNV